MSINGISANGYKYQLIGRFTEKADYNLVYGNASVSGPSYDIKKFATKIPESLNSLSLGEEKFIVKTEPVKVKPLFENNYWLWLIIGVVILILGGFTLKMLRNS